MVVLAGLLLAPAGPAGAQTRGTIELTTFPAIAVADGRTPIAVSAVVRDRGGSLVPNGTQVVFSSTLGQFHETSVLTQNGLARTTLTASSLPGIGKVTASALAFNAVAVLEFEFVSDRERLSTAQEFVEVFSTGALVYSTERRVLEASATGRRVRLKYREIEIEADDLQLRVQQYEVRARNAILRIGDTERVYTELFYRLNARTGFGMTDHTVTVREIVGANYGFRFREAQRERLGPVQIARGEITPWLASGAPVDMRFEDLSEVATIVGGQRVFVFPHRELLFERASVTIAGVTVLRAPLFRVDVNVATPLLTDQFFSVTGNRLAINYPHYLTLGPGYSSLLRFRTGTRYGTGMGVGGGTFLDYEVRWNRGDEMDGGFTIQGLARRDWGLSARQYLRLDDRSTLTAQMDFPANRALVGSVNINRHFDGFQTHISGNASRNLRGPFYASQNHFAVIETDPTNLGSWGRLFYGASLAYSEMTTAGARRSQTTYGLRARVHMLPIAIERGSTLNSTFSVASRSGRNVASGLTTTATMTLSSQLTPEISGVVTYDFLDDGFNSRYIGRHRLSFQTFASAGRFSAQAFVSRSLDIDRTNMFGDLSFRFSPTWRFAAVHTLDQYLGQRFQETNLVLAYRVGFREIGISYSTRTRRIGIELLGTSF
jgi:hypothetical protein